MKQVSFVTILNQDGIKPCCAGFKIGDNYYVYDLYRTGVKRPIKEVKKSISKINELLNKINDTGSPIVTTGFKKLLGIYNLPIDDRDYNIYDLHIDINNPLVTVGSQSKDAENIKSILDRFSKVTVKPYQKLLANASIVYKDLENTGFYVNDVLVHPQWSLDTFSGRSKSLGFNIQGHSENDYFYTISNNRNSVLIHFDWISADIRAASILAKDDILARSFNESDPYTYMQNIINAGQESDLIDRDECKLYLLKSINSMNVDTGAISDIYPKLCRWIYKCGEKTKEANGGLSTILDRQFKVSRAKNTLAVLNGAMQGTVAHAMQNVMRQVWLSCKPYLLTDIHDSLVLSVPNERQVIRSAIKLVAPIMMHPFKGIIEHDHIFPLKVSIGTKWKNWKLYKTYRNDHDYEQS